MVVHLAFGGVDVQIDCLLAVFHAGECGNVLCHEGFQRVGIEGTGEEEVEVAGRGEAFGIDFLDSFVGHLVQISTIQLSFARLVLVDGRHDGVVERLHGVLFGVFKTCLDEVHDVVIGVVVVNGRLEAQVNQFKERAEVLGSGFAGELFAQFAEFHVDGGLFAGEFLLQLGLGEVADAATVHHEVKCLDVGNVGIGSFVLSAETAGAEEHLRVVDVRLLEEDAGAVVEVPHLVAKVSVLCFGQSLGLGEVWHERFVLHVVHVGRELSFLGCFHRFLHVVGSGNGNAFLFGEHGEQNEVGVNGAGELLEDLVHRFHGHLRNEHLVGLVGVLNAGDGVVLKEVANILRHEEVVSLFVAVVIGFLFLAEELFASTHQFRGGESEACGALHLLHGNLHGGSFLSGLRNHNETVGVFCL